MVAPPLLAGGVKVTVAEASPLLALPIVGAPGTVAPPPPPVASPLRVFQPVPVFT
jgi:hypothetical protein